MLQPHEYQQNWIPQHHTPTYPIYYGKYDWKTKSEEQRGWYQAGQ